MGGLGLKLPNIALLSLTSFVLRQMMDIELASGKMRGCPTPLCAFFIRSYIKFQLSRRLQWQIAGLMSLEIGTWVSEGAGVRTISYGLEIIHRLSPPSLFSCD